MTLRLLLCVVLLLPASESMAGQGPEERFSALIGLARVKRDSGDAASAIRYFEEARQLRPFKLDELSEYFWVVTSKDDSKAVSVGRAILQEDARRDDIRERVVMAAVSLGDEETAVTVASEGRRVSPAARWSRWIGESHQRRQQATEAAIAFRAAVSAADARPEDGAALAIALEAAGQHAQAASAWAALPEPVWSGRPEWVQSRLRCLALGTAPALAAPELQRWIEAHPEDNSTREMLVEVWVRAGRSDRALVMLGPLVTGPDRDRWRRREAQLARAAGDRPRAIAALEDLLARQPVNTPDGWSLAELLVETREFPRAVQAIRKIASADGGCNERLLRLLDRIPDPAATDELVQAVTSRRCSNSATWTQRAIQRTVAASRHQDALAVMRTMSADQKGSAEMRRLEGQLLLWTGNPVDAVQPLRGALEGDPKDRDAREALVDAYRATGRPFLAWGAAGPMLGDSSTSDERRIQLAELALEADQPSAVAGILEAVTAGAIPSHVRTMLLARALLAEGRPGAAERMLREIPSQDLPPAGALALLDSSIAMRGHSDARTVAGRFSLDTAAWKDVLARRMLIESIAGDSDKASALRDALTRLDPVATIFADAETALARGEAAVALDILARVAAGQQPHRVADLKATALEGLGDLEAARAILIRLRRDRPDFAPFAIREADIAWRLDAANPQALERVLQLPSRFPKNEHAAFVASRGLQAAGRLSDARALLNALDAPSESLAIFRVEVNAAAAATATERIAVLQNGAARFPRVARIHTRLAAARLEVSDRDGALAASEQATSLAPTDREAWFIRMDATAATRSEDVLIATLHGFARAAEGNPSLTLAMADHVAGLARSPGDRILVDALAMVDNAKGEDPAHSALVRARLLAAADRWSESLASIDAALKLDSRSFTALRLRADVLSWAGLHDDSIQAYDVYLRLAPADLSARRQQARVTGWSGRYADAQRLYDGLRAAYPKDPAVRAEARAKNAFFDGRWAAAAAAYKDWIALEGDNTEARFELAEALRADGDVAAANTTLAALQSSTGHRLAGAALERAHFNRRPSVSLTTDHKQAQGYDGARLLEIRRDGATITVPLNSLGTTLLAADAVRVHAAGDGAIRDGYQAGGTAVVRMNPRLQFEGAGSLLQFGSASPAVELSARASWRPVDLWKVSVGADRQLVHENIANLDARLAGTGMFAGVGYASSTSSFEVRSSLQGLSDGNRRRRSTVSWGRSLDGRLRRLRLLAWGEELAYRTFAPGYFSPSGFVRFDTGVEYTQPLTRVLFRGAPRSAFAIGYLAGADSRGDIYHHPTARARFELRNGFALDARGGWIRSDGYDERSFTVGLRVGGGATVPDRQP